MITVTGTLQKPDGTTLADTDIRLGCEESTQVLPGVEVTITTDARGQYSFNLLEGLFLVQILQDEEFTSGAFIQITESSPTTASLVELINSYTGNA